MTNDFTEEHRTMNRLIAMHLDACRFYREAAGKAETAEMERSFHGLEKLHSDIVTDMGVAAHRHGLLMAPPADSGDDGASSFAFASLGRDLPLDGGFVRALERAESRCAEALEQAVTSEGVSTDLKVHVLDAAALLGKRHALIDVIRMMTSCGLPERPALRRVRD